MRTLRSKFLAFVLLPVIVGLVALSVLSYVSAREILTEQMHRTGRNYLRSVAAGISASIARIQTTLELLAVSEDLSEKSDGDLRQRFARLRGLADNTVTSIYIGFPDGRFFRTKKTPLPVGYDPRARPWYRDALNLAPGQPDGITAPYLDAGALAPTLTFFRKVLKEDGTLLGVLGVDMDVGAASETLMAKLPLPPGGKIVLTSSRATSLLHFDSRMVGLDIDQSGEPMDIQMSRAIRTEGRDYDQVVGKRSDGLWYMGFHRLSELGMCIVLLVPAREILSPLKHLALSMAGVAIPFAVGILILLLVMIRRISAPIIELKNSAVKIAGEDAYQEPLDVRTRDEIGQLTSAFNDMMAGLRQRDFIKDTFGRYVTREVVEELLDTPDGLKLGGEIREVTIMFSDLRGFTPLSEHLAPEQVIGILNRYLGKMADIITRFRGTVNEFVGDAILAIFGAPVSRPDHASRAVACAIEMQLAMEEINRIHDDLGLPALSMGIGIHTGEVIVGNIGSEKRVKYGVVGHHINLASRVESAAAGGQVLITPSTYRQVKNQVKVRSSRTASFKGVEEAIVLYEVTGFFGESLRELPQIPGEGEALERPISVSVFRMRDKHVFGDPLRGKISHFSGEWATISVSGWIEPSDEVRVDLRGTDPTEAPHIFARVLDARRGETGYCHRLRISYLSPGAAAAVTGSGETGTSG